MTRKCRLKKRGPSGGERKGKVGRIATTRREKKENEKRREERLKEGDV